MPAIDLSILNQRQTPAFYADVFANRPAAGFVGRIFVSTNTFAFYRDNGTGWDLIGGPGTGTITGSGAAGQVSFWNGASTITGENNLWWDSANNHLGINTNTPATALDVNHNGTLVAKFNNTTSANSLIAFENASNEQWWIGTENTNNDFLFYDATNFPTLSLRTTFKTSGQVLIGGGSTGSGKLVVESSTSDNGIQIVGANAPSLRIDSAATGPTKRIGLGISTATNNFIQGSADRDFCIFNGSTAAASPILFGIYSTGLGNVQEAARISPARNFIVGSTTDAGQRLQITGTSYFNGNVGLSATTATNKLTVNNVAGGFTTVASISESITANSATALLLQNSSATESNGTGINLDFAGAVNWLGRINTQFIGGTGTGNTDMLFFTASSGNLTERMRIKSDGNVGIGTPTPLSISNFTSLEVKGTNSGLVYVSNSSTQAGHLYVNSVGILIGSSSNDPLLLNTNNTERARFTAIGNFLIGTTTDSGKKLQVNGTIIGFYTYVLTRFTPASNDNIGLQDGQYNVINPSGPLAQLNLYLPSAYEGATVFIKFTQAVTTLTWNSGTVTNPPSSALANQLIMLVYSSATSTWY